jgi:hypothetical protein
MTNLLPTITPKSDQLNADDLIGRSLTIRVTKVSLCGDADQPIAIHYEGDDGKPYKPCKSMRRVMVHVWGPDGSKFAGRRMTLYRDDTIRFGNAPVGGIRISHMSGIKGEVTMALTATRAARKPFTVSPLPDDKADPVECVDLLTVLTEGRAAASRGSAALTAWWSRLTRDEKAAAKPTLDGELKAAAMKADEAAFDDGFDTAPPVSEGPVSDDAEPAAPASASEAGDEFTGDTPSGEQEGAGSDNPAPDPALAKADQTIAGFAFKTLAELKTLKEEGRFKAFVEMLKVQHPAKAAELTKALDDALDAFG